MVDGGTESVDEDTELIIDLSGYAEDPDGEPITNYLITQYPSHYKSFRLDGDEVHYTPEENWNSRCKPGGGNDRFKFKAQDERGAWSEREATINIHVKPVNDSPDAQGATVFALEDVEEIITLTADDPDLYCGGDTLTFAPDTESEQGGIVTQIAVDEVVYSPPANFSLGEDSFNFTVTDREGEISTATIKIFVFT